MIEGIVGGLGGALIGAVTGTLFAWRLSQRSSRNQARRQALVKTCEDLEEYRVVYAQWWCEYLLPDSDTGWAKEPTGTPDPVYLEMQRAVDRVRGRLRVDRILVLSLFSKRDGESIGERILVVLRRTSHAERMSPEQLDPIVIKTIDELGCQLRDYP